MSGALLDLKSVYRRLHVHPHDLSLRVSWKGHTFCDKALPLLLHLALKLFTAVANGLSWALFCEGVANLLHDLDNLSLLRSGLVHGRAGVPGLLIAPQIVVGPTTTILFPDILIDSVRQLPNDKQARLRQELRTLGDKLAATTRQLQSLIGLLPKFMRPGRLIQ